MRLGDAAELGERHRGLVKRLECKGLGSGTWDLLGALLPTRQHHRVT